MSSSTWEALNMPRALRPSTPSRQFVDYVLLWQLNLRTWFIVSARSTVYSQRFSLYPAILLWRFYAGNWPPPGHLDDRVVKSIAHYCQSKTTTVQVVWNQYREMWDGIDSERLEFANYEPFLRRQFGEVARRQT